MARTSPGWRVIPREQVSIKVGMSKINSVVLCFWRTSPLTRVSSVIEFQSIPEAVQGSSSVSKSSPMTASLRLTDRVRRKDPSGRKCREICRCRTACGRADARERSPVSSAVRADLFIGSAAQVCGQTYVVQDGCSPDILPSVALLDVDT